MDQLKEKVEKSKFACLLNARIYKYMADDSADLSVIEQDVADARNIKMRFSESVTTRLLVWMCEARMRVNDYDAQSWYLTEAAAVTLFELSSQMASVVCLNALESSVTRLISILTAEMLDNDTAEVNTLRQCTKSYLNQGGRTLLFLSVVHALPAIMCCVLRGYLCLYVAFAFVRGPELLAWQRVGHILPYIDALVCADQAEIVFLTKVVDVLAPLETHEVDEAEAKEVSDTRASIQDEPLVKAIGQTNKANGIVINICVFSRHN